MLTKFVNYIDSDDFLSSLDRATSKGLVVIGGGSFFYMCIHILIALTK